MGVVLNNTSSLTNAPKSLINMEQRITYYLGGYTMGFMGFGKKKEEDLDIPPPPPMQSSSKNVLPPEASMKDWDIPPISKPTMPDFDDLLKEPQMTTPRVVIPPKPVPHKPEPKHIPSMAAPSMPAPMHRDIPEGKPVFIEINKYKQALKDLGTVKSSLKQSDDEISELVGDITDEEKAFSKLHSRLSEVEKKLIELESSLFTQ